MSELGGRGEIAATAVHGFHRFQRNPVAGRAEQLKHENALLRRVVVDLLLEKLELQEKISAASDKVWAAG